MNFDSVFFPKPSPPHYKATSYPRETIWVPSDQGAIPCFLIQRSSADLLLMFAHGNGCDIGSIYETLTVLGKLLNVHVLAWEYPGYGSAPGTTSTESVNYNCDVVANWLMSIGWPMSHTILYGQSIGTGPTCRLAARLHKESRPPAAIILQSPYTSLQEVVRSKIGRFAGLIANRWTSDVEVKSITASSILFIHGARDELIPKSHSEQLYDLTTSRRKHHAISEMATHNECNWENDVILPILGLLHEYIRSTPSPIPLDDMKSTVSPPFVKGRFHSSYSSSSSSSPSWVHEVSPLLPLKVDSKYYIVPRQTFEKKESSILSSMLASSVSLSKATLSSSLAFSQSLVASEDDGQERKNEEYEQHE